MLLHRGQRIVSLLGWFSWKRHLGPVSKGLLRRDHSSPRESSVSPVSSPHYSRASVALTVQFSFQPLDGPFNQEIPPPAPLLPLSSSLPTKWMTAFRNTRVRHDSEVHMLCHLCSTCFGASAAREAEEDQACDSTSSQLMLQADAVSKLQG